MESSHIGGPPPFFYCEGEIIGLGLSIHIFREAARIEKKRFHLEFYNQAWPGPS